jgi:PAS domain S-box-containing protein
MVLKEQPFPERLRQSVSQTNELDRVQDPNSLHAESPTADHRVASETRLAGIIDSAMDAIITVNEEHRILVFNRAAEDMFLCPASEAIGTHLDRFLPDRFRATHSDHIRAFSKTAVSTRTMAGTRSVFGQRANGEEFPLEASISQVETNGQKLFTVIMRDVSDKLKAEERFRLVIESMPNGIVMVDSHGTISLVNAQTERAFGYKRDELLGQPIEILVPVRYRHEHVSFRDTFLGSPVSRPMGSGRDLYGIRKDGSEFPVEIGLSPINTDKGLMVLGTIVDISERKQTENRLRQSEAQLSGIIGSAMDAIVSVDEDENIVLFNNAAERMFLYPAEDAIGEKLNRFIPERFRSIHHKHIKSFGSTKVTKRSMGSLGAIFGLRADGSEFPIEASISQLQAEGRKYYTVILRDITERKRAEETMTEQARILDLAPVLIRDLDSHIVFWNSGAQHMYGWTDHEVLNRLSHHVLQTVFPRPIEEIKARLFARGHWEGELIHTRKDGRQMVVASHWVLHRDENNKPKAILEINNDITDRRKAEQEVHRLNEELEQRVADRTAELQAANRELEAFSYSVSHDLRAPLRHINGFSQALVEDYADQLDDTAKGYVREVRSASQEMAQLIDDVLQLARVSRAEIFREQVDLSEVAREIVEKHPREPGRTIHTTIQEGLFGTGDKRLLGIVLTNLLHNAWKFTSKKDVAEISFSGFRQANEQVFSVKDNGAGFDMAFADKLFGAFQRLHSGDEFEGTGIGLATVQRIVNRHGGRTWAEGHVGTGATFFFTLPIRKENSND